MQSLSFRQRIGLELQRSLRHTEAQLHPLRTLFWECTLRCNMACRHCGSDCKVQPAVKDMPAEDFLRVIDSITPHVDPHKVFVIFTGGEALLRPDLEEVGLELYRREYPWGVVTNGFLLDERRLESLMAGGMHSITVSLDGFEADHNWMRCHPLSFQKATHAIRLLAQQKDLLWDVVTCVNPRNYPRLSEFRDYLVSLGVPAWRLFSIFPMGRAAGNPELQFTDEQFRGLLDFIRDCREGNTNALTHSRTNALTNPRTDALTHSRTNAFINVSYACEGFLGPYEQQVRDHFFHCRSGIDVASLRCDGAISGCTSVRSRMDQGNIYRGDDFWDVWQNRFHSMRDRSWTRKDQCASCRVWRYCEGSGLHLYDDDGRLLTCHYRRLMAGK